MIWLARLARLAGFALRILSLPFLAIGWLATPILWGARVCLDRAREWDPRLWDRDHDPRSDTRERRP